jgi:8-oxo-dGTP pyrophosphatase MutT (NUDIX family)
MESKNPWKKIDSRVVYKNDWITVREDNVIRPDGGKGIYGVVETRIATGVVAVTESNEIYLVGQFRYPMNEYTWEIIEGGAEIGESPLVAAKRELEEEAGLIASSWEELGGEIHLSNCHSSEVGKLYLAKGLVETEKNPDNTEVLQIRKIPFTSCLGMLDRGEIKDGLSLIGILRYERFLRN